MTFYNTTNECHGTLKDYENITSRQEKKVLAYFMYYEGKFLSPEDALNCFPEGNVPITSVRRTITNLTKKGILKKTNVKTEGMYGRLTHTWQYLSEAKTKQLPLL